MRSDHMAAYAFENDVTTQQAMTESNDYEAVGTNKNQDNNETQFASFGDLANVGMNQGSAKNRKDVISVHKGQRLNKNPSSDSHKPAFTNTSNNYALE